MSAAENRYSRVSRRMWRDEKFRALSAPKPNARDLWLFLLTGPHCTAIPGLFVLGEAAMAEELGWPIAATRSALEEIEHAGMLRVDRASRVLWLPNALTHNPPASPNVVVGWRTPWSEIPGCALKDAARDGLRAGLLEMGSEFARSFAIALGEEKPRPSPNPSGGPRPKALAKALVEPSPKPSPSQEQDQEQEQERSELVADALRGRSTDAGQDQATELDRLRSEVAKDEARRAKNRAKAKAREENPPPFSVGEAFELLASTAKGRFVPGVERDWTGGIRIAVAKMIRTYPAREEWQCLGRWLAAGGDAFRKVLGPSWAASTACVDAMARSREWSAQGEGPVGDPMQSGSFVLSAPRPAPTPVPRVIGVPVANPASREDVRAALAGVRALSAAKSFPDNDPGAANASR